MNWKSNHIEMKLASSKILGRDSTRNDKFHFLSASRWQISVKTAPDSYEESLPRKRARKLGEQDSFVVRSSE